MTTATDYICVIAREEKYPLFSPFSVFGRGIEHKKKKKKNVHRQIIINRQEKQNGVGFSIIEAIARRMRKFACG